MPRVTKFSHYADTSYEDWDIRGKPDDERRATQDAIYARLRLDDEPATLDEWQAGRAQAWRTLRARRGLNEDREAAAAGDRASLLERESKSKKVAAAKKRKRRDPTLSMVLTFPQPDKGTAPPPTSGFYVEKRHGQLLTLDDDYWPQQLRFISAVRKLRVTAAPGPSFTWQLQLPEEAVRSVGQWFAQVQLKRKPGHRQVRIGDVWADGYGEYPLGLERASQLQPFTNLKLWPRELAAARADGIPGFALVETAVLSQVSELFGLPGLQNVRSHFLDQDFAHESDEHKAVRAAKQASFGLHTDKDKEYLDGKRVNSIFFTVLIRIGGGTEQPRASALQVLGSPPARLDSVGDNHMFMSQFFHYTAVRGGHKLALFVGYPEPNFLSSRLRSLQQLT